MISHHLASLPDRLYYRDQIIHSLNALAKYNASQRLKVTLEGIHSVSKIQMLLQKIKSFLGGTNRCSHPLIKYESLKLIHQIHLQELQNDPLIASLIHKISHNQAFEKQYGKIRALFRKCHVDKPSIKESKNALLQHYQLHKNKLGLSFWGSFDLEPSLLKNEESFGQGALLCVRHAPSFSEKIDLYRACLNLGLDGKTYLEKIVPQFDACVASHSFKAQQDQKEKISGVYLAMARIAYESKEYQEAIRLFALFPALENTDEEKLLHAALTLYDIKTAEPILQKHPLNRFPTLLPSILQLYSQDLDDDRFHRFYLRTKNENVAYPEGRKKFVGICLKRGLNGNHPLLHFQQALEDAHEEEIKIEWVLKMLACCKEPRYQDDYLRLYFKVRSKAPNLSPHLPKLSIRSPEALLQFIQSSQDTLQKRHARLEYHLLMKERAMEALKPHSYLASTWNWFWGNEPPPKGDQFAADAFKQAYQYAETEDLENDWIEAYGNTLVRLGRESEAIQLLYTFIEKRPEQRLQDTPMQILDKVVRRACVILLKQPLTLKLFSYLRYAGNQLIVERGGQLALAILNSTLTEEQKLYYINRAIKRGPHPHLYFLKGELSDPTDTESRLLAYRWAYTLAPQNPFCAGQELIHRTLLADNQATAQDIERYRQDAIEAQGSCVI